jgi:hypothetical protein
MFMVIISQIRGASDDEGERRDDRAFVEVKQVFYMPIFVLAEYPRVWIYINMSCKATSDTAGRIASAEVYGGRPLGPLTDRMRLEYRIGETAMLMMQRGWVVTSPEVAAKSS